MKRRWNDLSWAVVLVVATVATGVAEGMAGFVLGVLAVIGAHLAGRRMASLPLALIAFGVGAGLDLLLSFFMAPGNALSLWLTTVLLVFFVCVLPWWWGRYRRLRAERAAHERQLIADHARLRERARIAEDMHDQLGHDLALIALGSGALQVAEGATEQQRQTAAAVREQTAAAIERLHDIVSVLREEGTAAARQPADESVEELIERARRAGATIRLDRTPPPPGITEPSPLARQAAYRVVQEALTNAAKYAAGSAVDVRYDESSDPVTVSVRNAPASPSAGAGQRRDGQAGQGLTGLDERLSVLGGTFEAGPESGGFAVIARLPRAATVGDAVASPGAQPHAGLRPSPGSVNRDAEIPVADLQEARRSARSLQWRSAALPIALAVLLALVMLVLQLVTVRMTALPPADYAAIEPGQTRGQLEAMLPPSSIHQASPMLGEPAAPTGTRCEYFAARANVFDLGSDMFRLCFRGDVLVSKDRLTSTKGS
ncbi:sensor histidine kinase [Arthrobacter sp.]|uniref:sensor histidine kinase n=1 Tax=Arthrobacter sp. TaxID=1667 RepID=UPI003A9215AA